MNNNTITPDDALEQVKAEEDQLDAAAVIEEAEEVLKSIERIKEEVKLMKTFINRVKEIGIE